MGSFYLEKMGAQFFFFFFFFFGGGAFAPPPPPVDQGLFMCEVSRSHTTTHHSRLDSSGRGINLSQRSLPDNTQHTQQRDIHAPGGIRTHNLRGEWPQTYALDRAATGIGTQLTHNQFFFVCSISHSI